MNKRQTGYYWCIIKYNQWHIFYWDFEKQAWNALSPFLPNFTDDSFEEIDERTIKRLK